MSIDSHVWDTLWPLESPMLAGNHVYGTCSARGAGASQLFSSASACYRRLFVTNLFPLHSTRLRDGGERGEEEEGTHEIRPNVLFD